jgi:hypothetical protein
VTYKRVQFYGKVADGGNDSRVRVAHHASLNMADALTVIVRVYINPADNSMQGPDHGIVCKSNGTGPGGGFILAYDGTAVTGFRFVWSMRSGAAWYACSPAAYTALDKGWYHVVTTFDRTLGANNIKLFQNGMQLGQLANNTAMDTNVLDVIIGGITTTAWMMRGYISEVQIYNRALTAAEVNYDYLHPNNPVRRGCVLSLVQDQIDRPAAGTWRDTSPQMGNNGTITNATTSTYNRINAGRNTLFFPTAARSDRIDCGNGASLALGTVISLEFWIKTTKDTAGFMLADKWSANNGYQVMFGSKTLALYSDTGYSIISAVIPDFTDGTWKHVVLTHTDGAATGEVYVNGVNKTNTRAAFALTNSATNLYIGNNAAFSQSLVGGYIAAARIYNRILTAAEVAYNHEHPNNPIRRGLVLNLSQESLYGTQWVDLSGNANHGTITGAVVKNLASTVDGR